MTNGNHVPTKRRKMVRVHVLMPADLLAQLAELERLEPDLNRSDHVRALVRDGLRRRRAS
jgi:metal-responsive CopG/Arc/MetJ family transcriptional regulator